MKPCRSLHVHSSAETWCNQASTARLVLVWTKYAAMKKSLMYGSSSDASHVAWPNHRSVLGVSKCRPQSSRIVGRLTLAWSVGMLTTYRGDAVGGWRARCVMSAVNTSIAILYLVIDFLQEATILLLSCKAGTNRPSSALQKFLDLLCRGKPPATCAPRRTSQLFIRDSYWTTWVSAYRCRRAGAETRGE